jgi:hypothetical protein
MKKQNSEESCSKSGYVWLMQDFSYDCNLSQAKKQMWITFYGGGPFLVEDEPNTTACFAMRMDPPIFVIFDAFLNESCRQSTFKANSLPFWEKTNDLSTTIPTNHLLYQNPY